MTTCGDCKRYLKQGECPRAEYKSREQNRIACLPGDESCELFEAKKKEKKTRPVFKLGGLAEQGYFESIYHDGTPTFLVYKDKVYSLLNEIMIRDKVYSPKETSRIYTNYGFSEGPVPSREELYWRIREEFQRFLDIEAIWLDILPACVLLSYQQEKLTTVPYLYFFGDNESGKSTALKILSQLCYRPMYALTVPSADIYGYLDDTDAIGSILEDEVQGIDKDTDKIKIYKAGYTEGATVPRTFMTQHERRIDYFRVFCFKAVASERLPSVKGFRERFIEINMVEGFPQKEWSDRTPEDFKRFCDLRNDLLKWRLASKDWELPNPEITLKGRIKEIWKPILQITHGLPIYETLTNFVEEQRDERITTKQNTFEGHLVKVVIDLMNKAQTPVTYIAFQTIWDSLLEDLDGTVDTRKPNVMDTPEFWTITKQKVGYRLREILGGKSKTVRKKIVGEKDADCPRIKAYEFDQNKIRRIAKKYGHELVTKLPSEPTSEGMLKFFSKEKGGKGMLKMMLKPKKFLLEKASIPSRNSVHLVTRLRNRFIHHGSCKGEFEPHYVGTDYFRFYHTPCLKKEPY